jgi:DNA helicase-2/ATP-dependent DNA helicase PcrA
LKEKNSALQIFLESAALASSRTVKEDGEAVRLMTIHSAKGLEFDTVFLTGCNEGLLPLKCFDNETKDDHLEEEQVAGSPC